MEVGEILGRKIKTDERKIWKAAPIRRGGNIIAKVDLVFETEDGKLIIVEVKSTIEPKRIWYMYGDAIKSLKVEPGYIELIKEYGVELEGEGIRRDVEAYIAFITFFDKDNRMWFIEMIMEVS
ncbi:MAG: hypothetical protein QXP45_02535 [Thermoproteota archaeon]